MSETTQAYVGAFIRFALVSLPFVSSKLDADQITQAASIIVAIVALVWSIWQKKSAIADKHATVAVAVNKTVAAPENAAQIIADAKAGKF